MWSTGGFLYGRITKSSLSDERAMHARPSSSLLCSLYQSRLLLNVPAIWAPLTTVINYIVKSTETKTFGSGSFRSVVPIAYVWNSLPPNLRGGDIGQGQFESVLKTGLLRRRHYRGHWLYRRLTTLLIDRTTIISTVRFINRKLFSGLC